MNEKDFSHLIQEIFEKESLLLATFSGAYIGEISKVVIRPLVIKGKLHYQITKNCGTQAFHSNLLFQEIIHWIEAHLKSFKQLFLYTTEADYHILVSKKGNLTVLKKNPSKVQRQQSHNRQKEYLLQEGTPIPFLVQLNVMDEKGKIFAGKKDKFRQINRFLEIVEDILPQLSLKRKLRIVDFGCGKAYLTFALYHFLRVIKGYEIEFIGIDLKKDVIEFCQKLALSLGYQKDLYFIQGDIESYQNSVDIDIVVSLHACDTATDAALEKAIRFGAKAILSVPCCQHELLEQIKQEALRPLLKHGILKERFSALATDAARAQLLEVLGYQVQTLEFIDFEATPKNLLIRATKCSHPKSHQKKAWQDYLFFKQSLHINPSLERRFQNELNKIN